MFKKQNNTFKGDVLRLVSGTGLAQIIALAAAPILARLYGVEAFGIFALFSAITGIIIPLANMRYELSIILPKNDEEAANLLALSLAITILISALAILIIWVAGESILTLINATELFFYIWLIPIAIFTGGINTALNYWSTRTKHFTQLSIARVINQFTTTGGSLGLGFAGHTSSGSLISASIAGQIVATLILAVQIFWSNGKLIFSSIHLHGILAGIKRYKKFPIFSSWGALLNAASWQIPVLMLGAFFSPVVVGLYSIGFRLIQIPMNLIGSSISQVFFQRGSEAKANGDLARIVEGLFNRLLIIGLLPSLIIMIIGAELFAYVFGEDWREAGVYVQILAPWALVWFISSPLSTIYAIQERQKEELTIHGIIFIFRVAAITIGGLYGDARLAITLFSLGGIISYGYLIRQIFKLSNLSIITALRKAYKPAITAIIFSLPIALLAIKDNASIIFLILLSPTIMLIFFYHQRKSLVNYNI